VEIARSEKISDGRNAKDYHQDSVEDQETAPAGDDSAMGGVLLAFLVFDVGKNSGKHLGSFVCMIVHM
jgi:hypothetical protein